MDNTEKLLDAWINLSNVLRNERFVKTMTFNEVIVLRILNRSDDYIQVKSIVDETKILKSLINRTINDLEEKKYLVRFRFNDNRKNVYLKITELGRNAYKLENNNSRKIVDAVLDTLGLENTLKFIEYLNTTTEVICGIYEKEKV